MKKKYKDILLFEYWPNDVFIKKYNTNDNFFNINKKHIFLTPISLYNSEKYSRFIHNSFIQDDILDYNSLNIKMELKEDNYEDVFILPINEKKYKDKYWLEFVKILLKEKPRSILYFYERFDVLRNILSNVKRTYSKINTEILSYNDITK